VEICAASKFLCLRNALPLRDTWEMMRRENDKKPGDLIIDRYMPDATGAEREKARSNLRAYLAVVLRIASRVEDEDRSQGRTGTSPESAVDSSRHPAI